MTDRKASSPFVEDGIVAEAALARFARSPTQLKACLLLTIFINRLILALNAPFFPTHAKENHNLSNSQIGWTFSVFSLTNMLLSPIVGFTLRNIGMKKTVVTGQFILVTGLLLFGSLDFYESDETYFLVALTSRIILGFGGSATLAPSFAILANAFPNDVDLMMSLGQAASGLGYTIGPVFGGAFFLLGGFTFPFIAASILGLATILLTCCVMKKDQRLDQREITFKEKLSYLNKWEIIFPALCSASTFMAIGGLEVSIGNHLKEDFRLDLGSILIVLSFLAFSYVISAAILGPLLAKGAFPRDTIMMLGMLGVAMAMIFVGPEFPFDSDSPLPIFFGGPMIGIGGAMSVVPVLSEQTHHALKDKSRSKEDVNNTISGIFAWSMTTGGLLGFSVVGMVSDGYDFRTAYDIVGFTALVVGVSYFTTRFISRLSTRNQEGHFEEPLLTDQIILSDRSFHFLPLLFLPLCSVRVSS